MMKLSKSVLLSPPARWTTRRCWRGYGRTVSDPVLTQNTKKRAGLDGNNGRSAERTVANGTNRSRNDSDLPLRQPTDQKAGGSNPSRRTTANLLISMGSRFLFYLSMNSICLFSNVFLTSLTQAFCQLICKALLSGSV